MSKEFHKAVREYLDLRYHYPNAHLCFNAEFQAYKVTLFLDKKMIEALGFEVLL